MPAACTESWSLGGGNDLKVASRNEMANRTTRLKRRQGTMRAARGSRTPLKQYSPENHLPAGGEGVTQPEPNTAGSVRGEDPDDPPGSESVARMEREVRNLGRPLCLPAGREACWGRIDQREKAVRWVQRGESDRFTVGRGKCPASGREPDPLRRGRQNNAARKGNMDWKE